MKIWHIRDSKKQDYVIVDNKLILDQSGQPKRHKGKIIATLVLLEDKIGWAICCPEDRFSKKVGVSIATGRAKSQKQMTIPAKLLKHVKKMANKYEVKLPEQTEIETTTKIVKSEDITQGTVLKIQMKYRDDPYLFDEWIISQSDIDKIPDTIIIGQNAKRSKYAKDNGDEQNAILVGYYHFPLQLFGIKQ